MEDHLYYKEGTKTKKLDPCTVIVDLRVISRSDVTNSSRILGEDILLYLLEYLQLQFTLQLLVHTSRNNLRGSRVKMEKRSRDKPVIMMMLRVILDLNVIRC